MISVIIPVHNEEAVLARCLHAITDGADTAQLQVVVACNGCSDRSASIAKSFPFPVQVVVTDEASKPMAWNQGEQLARGFPRFYVDADVTITWSAIRKVALALEDPAVLAAAPQIEIDLSGASALVRAYYRIWLQLPYARSDMIGSGVFALSQAGRSRFGRFPDLIADDEFVRRCYRAGERFAVPGCSFTVFAPRDLASLIRIKTRSRLGRVQLRRAALGPSSREDNASSLTAVVALARRPSNWGALGVYLAVTLWTRWLARRRAAGGDFAAWGRDDSSRQSAETAR